MSLNQRERVSVVLTPPEPWQPARDRYRGGESPDPMAIYRAMAAEGVDVTLLDPYPRPWNPFFEWHPIYMGLDPVRAMNVIFGKRKIDMVLSVFEASCAVPLLLRRVCFYKPKIAMWDIVPEEVWKPRRLLQDFVVPRIDHVFLLGAAQRAYLDRRWQAAERSTVVHQHVDADFYRPRSASLNGPILAIGDDVGRDFDTFMRAIHDLDIDVIVKTRRPLLEIPGRRARVKKISERLSFTELRDLYDGAAFVVVPLRETLNVSGVGSILEAMAMAKAVVVSDNPPLRDYFENQKTALVAPVGDAQAMREAIAHLKRDPEKRQALGQGGRAFVEKSFANPVFGARLARAIRTVLAA